ncbi:hypothetical protein COO60DRAFT_1542666, partial [Scenedesmus sp. NREL 46B-D3]
MQHCMLLHKPVVICMAPVCCAVPITTVTDRTPLDNGFLAPEQLYVTCLQPLAAISLLSKHVMKRLLADVAAARAVVVTGVGSARVYMSVCTMLCSPAVVAHRCNPSGGRGVECR